MVTWRIQSMNLRSSLTAARDWSKKWDLPINPTKGNYLTIEREVPLRLSFFPDGSDTPMRVSKLVKYLGVQTDNQFSSSAQSTEAANKARRLILMIRHSFQNLAKLVVIGALARPHLQYGMLACSQNLVADINHLDRIQRLATRLVTGMRHLPYEERLQHLGHHSLQWRRLRADLITAFKIFKGLLDIDPSLFFFPPARRGLRGHPYKVLQGASHHRRRGSAFSVRVVKYWNKLLLSIFSRKGWRKFGQKSFPIFPLD